MLEAALQNQENLLENDERRLCPAQLAESNINSSTLLATDYLNHFNEMIMLFELLPDMPECLEDIQAWKPLTYQEHFRKSAFQGRDLAIEAYEHVAPHVRGRFEAAINMLDRNILQLSEDVTKAIGNRDQDWLNMLCSEAVMVFSPLLDELNCIIHGSMGPCAKADEAASMPDHDQAQAQIDALFD